VSVQFRPAKRENVPLLLGVAGGTGSGKTFSALRIARGIAGGHPIAFLDTENGRANLYADHFPEMMHGDVEPPFRPVVYSDGIDNAETFLEEQGVPAEHRVIVVDSASHEWYGDGGCLAWHDELTGGDKKKSPSAWAKIKPEHTKMVMRLLRVQAHVILCFRAAEKMDIVREGGETKFVPKKTLTGLDGWVPISEKNLPFEMTASFLLLADAPGIPKPIKLPGDLAPFVPLDRPLDEEVGKQLAAWARGGAAEQASPGPSSAPAEPTDAEASLGGSPAEPRSAFSAPAGARLTRQEFKTKREAAGISTEQVKTKAAELFPGKTYDQISEFEWAYLWQALDPQEALV